MFVACQLLLMHLLKRNQTYKESPLYFWTKRKKKVILNEELWHYHTYFDVAI